MMTTNLRKNKLLKGIAICTMSLFLFTGCGGQGTSAQNTQTALADTGYLILSVNPEIRIAYNKDGVVTDLTGRNDDGKQIVADYQDYIGKDCDVVVSDLIKEIHNAGFFVDDIDGNSKNIVIQIEPGSVVPDDKFVDGVSKKAQDTVKNLKSTSNIVSIDKDDYDDKYTKADKPSSYITLAKAQEIALKQAGVNASDARFEDKEFDLDDGTPIYELEFKANGIEFEYDIHAVSGKVLKAERDGRDGINDDRYDDYYDDDYDDRHDDDKFDDDRHSTAVNNPQNNAPAKRITLDEAKAVALKHAGVNAADARFEDREFDLDDGTPLYELEFTANGVEYEYDIHAETSAVMKAERDKDDDSINRQQTVTVNNAPAPSADDRYDDDYDDRYDDDRDDRYDDDDDDDWDDRYDDDDDDDWDDRYDDDDDDRDDRYDD